MIGISAFLAAKARSKRASKKWNDCYLVGGYVTNSFQWRSFLEISMFWNKSHFEHTKLAFFKPPASLTPASNLLWLWQKKKLRDQRRSKASKAHTGKSSEISHPFLLLNASCCFANTASLSQLTNGTLIEGSSNVELWCQSHRFKTSISLSESLLGVSPSLSSEKKVCIWPTVHAA